MGPLSDAAPPTLRPKFFCSFLLFLTQKKQPSVFATER